MYNLIERYMTNLTKDQLNNFAIQNNVTLSEEELDFTYEFVKKNWETIIRNPNLLNLERFKDRYSIDIYYNIL